MSEAVQRVQGRLAHRKNNFGWIDDNCHACTFDLMAQRMFWESLLHYSLVVGGKAREILHATNQDTHTFE